MIAALAIGGYVLGALVTAFVMGAEDPKVWSDMDRKNDYSPIGAVMAWPLAWVVMIPVYLVNGATKLGALCGDAVRRRRVLAQRNSELDAALELSESGYRQNPARCPHCGKFIDDTIHQTAGEA